ncbi:DUF6056 family protein [Streptomyces endophyticus]|uniref:DUF6056 family protein n=1 Tax=Streptomyces endophyticus TaxID=714166 RepID=A0ABU6F2T0_9ACTN|nr:DUF6056 family protein [Streptomyces endophyticus]MEB8338304.1 DUF6056 family protein [Streptomyces endophyticus]
MVHAPEKAVLDQRIGAAPESRRTWWRTAAPLGLLALLPLAVFAFAAWNARLVRPGGDDWCFLPVVHDGGLPAIVEKFYLHDNGRIVNAVLVWAYARFGETGQQWFAPVSGVLVLALLWAFAVAVLRAARLRVPWCVPLLAASMVTALFLFGSPNTYKTFYWPAASVSHTLPPVFACAAAVPVLLATSRRGKLLALGIVVLAGVSLGLVSEETSVVTATVLACALLISGHVFRGARRRFLRLCCTAGIASLVLGTLILYTSPGASRRRERKHASTMFTPDSLLGALHGFGEIAATVLTTWWYLGAVVVGVVVGVVSPGVTGRVAPGRKAVPVLVAGAGALLVSGYVCTVITYPVFKEHVVSSTRLWNDYLLLYLLLLAFAGVLVGHAVRGRVSRTAPVLAAGGVLCAVVCVALTASLAGLGATLQTHARDWDRQDRWMRGQAAAGAQVLPYKRLPQSRMTEPFRHGGKAKWPASCIATYYGVEHIKQAHKLP